MTCLERSAIRAARLQGCTDDDVADMLRSLRAQDAAAAAEDAAARAMDAAEVPPRADDVRADDDLHTY